MKKFNRSRRLRLNAPIRALVKETHLGVDDFVTPLFVTEGKNIKEPIPSLKNCFRFSIDLLLSEIESIAKLNLKAILLFVKVPEHLKDNSGQEAYNPKGLMQRVIKSVKQQFPELLVFSDVALDPYSMFGHDGIVKDQNILNDKTIDILAKISLSHAEAGVDFVAPSDMMDGRVLKIRTALDNNGFQNTGIMSYCVKYASSLYGPFREALDSAPGFGDKKTYQMDFHNRLEAVKEVNQDIIEGTDVIMIKPAGMYLDIIREIRTRTELPVAAYQVSGEYAMLNSAIEKGWLTDEAIYESLVGIKRSGATFIVSYFSKYIAHSLK